MSLSYVYLISSDDWIFFIRVFVQINILEGKAGYVVLKVHCVDYGGI